MRYTANNPVTESFPMSPRDKRVSVAPDVLMRELEGEAVLLNLDSETYFGLDEIGTTMWTTLATSATLESAYCALLEIYDADPERLRADLLDFVGQLAEAGLVDVQDIPA